MVLLLSLVCLLKDRRRLYPPLFFSLFTVSSSLLRDTAVRYYLVALAPCFFFFFFSTASSAHLKGPVLLPLPRRLALLLPLARPRDRGRLGQFVELYVFFLFTA